MENDIKKIDNRGYSLIMVIICLAFILLLGGVVVSVTMVNARMKVTRKDEEHAFYYDETALNEIKTGLEQTIKTAISKGYMEVLEHYSDLSYFDPNYETMSEALIEEARKKKYLSNCYDWIKRELSISETSTGTWIDTVLSGFVVTNRSNVSLGNHTRMVKRGENQVVFKHVTVITKYYQLESKITTDLVITIPEVTFEYKTLLGQSESFYDGYALIADSGIKVEDGHNNEVIGDVYAGRNGIVVQNVNTGLECYINKLISAGDIKVLDQAKFTIGANQLAPEIWGANIQIDSIYHSGTPTSLSITGENSSGILVGDPQIYVKDDLELRAETSEVRLAGKYVGFTTNPSLDGSAILVNGKESYLNLEQLSELFLGGVGFISFPQNQLAIENLNDGVFAEVDYSSTEEKGLILTGESLSVRNNQCMYLVPHEFMVAGHNPMTYLEYQGIGANCVKVDDLKSALGYSSTSTAFEIQPIIYTSTAGNKIVYVYLKFLDVQEANQFLNREKDYLNSIPGNTDEWYDLGSSIFQAREVSVNPSLHVIAAGNVVDYKRNAITGEIIQTQIPRDESITDFMNYSLPVESSNVTIGQMEAIYQNLSHTLQMEVPGVDSVFDYLIDRNKIREDAAIQGSNIAYQYGFTNSYVKVPYSDGNAEFKVIFVNGDIEITSSMNGIVVATGNVTVKGNVTGMVIAGGDIKVSLSSKITYNNTMIENLFMYADAYFADYFRIPPVYVNRETASGTEDASMIDFGNIISYDHWTRE